MTAAAEPRSGRSGAAHPPQAAEQEPHAGDGGNCAADHQRKDHQVPPWSPVVERRKVQIVEPVAPPAPRTSGRIDETYGSAAGGIEVEHRVVRVVETHSPRR